MPARGTRLVLISGSRMGESINPKETPPAATPECQHQAVSSGVCTEDAPPGPVRCTPLPPVSTGTFNLFLGLVQAPAQGQAQGLPRAARGMRPTSLHTRAHTHRHTAHGRAQHAGKRMVSRRGRMVCVCVGESADPLGPGASTAPREGPLPLEGALLLAPGPLARAAEGTDHMGEDPEGSAPGPVSQ